MKQSKIKLSKNRKILSSLPELGGVYLFWSKKKVIYVGKANNIKNRLASYFSTQLASKTKAMIGEATHLSYIIVDSELNCLLLEASLIKNYQPKYNFAAKDDKHPLYIRIIKEEFPRVQTARKIEESQKNIAFFGPFVSSSSVRKVLKHLRKIFPYAQHRPSGKPCIYWHLGLCKPCPSQIVIEKNKKIKDELKKEYLENIRMLKMVLKRKSLVVEKKLLKSIRNYSSRLQFEKAMDVRDQLIALSYVTQKPLPAFEFLKNPNLTRDLRTQELIYLKNILKKYSQVGSLSRIECYDISHLAGTNPTASMVCFVEGEPEKDFYRRFKIYQKFTKSDVHSLSEVAKRRVKHLSDWGRPDLVIVDGGKPQVSVFRQAFEPYSIPVIGIAKRFESLIIPVKKYGTNTFKTIRLPDGPARNLVIRIRDEAHRFARKYHLLLVKKTLQA